jgi:hypothetical protein
MKLKKFILFFLILLFSNIILTNFSNAITISPPSYETNFEPNSKHKIIFTLINKDSKLMKIKVNATGTLKDYITFGEEEFELKPLSRKNVEVILNLPENLEPGENIGKIEFLDNTPAANGMFRISVGVIGKIKIFAPYPGYYATMNFETFNINLGQQINYRTEIHNKGKKDIVNARLQVDFLDVDNKKIISKTHEGINIPSTEKFNLNQYFDSHDLFVSGEYLATSTFYYEDNKKIEKNKTFNVGIYSFDILNYPDYLYEQQITPYVITAKNYFNGKVDNVYASLTIDGKEYSSHKISFRNFEKKNITIYVDNMNFNLGETYKAKLTLFFGEESISKDIKLKIIEPPKKLESPKKSSGIEINTSVILIAVVLILIIFNIILLLKKGKKEETKEKEHKKEEKKNKHKK